MINKTTLLLIGFLPVLVLNPIIGFGQYEHEIDSLKVINQQEGDKEKLVDNYSFISELFSYTDVDSAIYYTNLALSLSKQIQYTKGKAQSYYDLSFYKDRKGEISEAIVSLEKATDNFTQLGDSCSLVGCYNNLGVYYSYSTNQKKSLEYFLKALYIGEKLNDTYFLANVYSNIASFYNYVEVYRLAIKYYYKALEQENLWEDNSENIALSHSYIGLLNVELKRLDEAKKHINKAKELLPEVIDNYRETELYSNFASYYLEINDLVNARFFIEKAQQTNDSIDYPRLHTEILALWGDWFFKEKQYQECLVYYDKAIELYKELESYEYLDEIYLQKAEAFSELGYHNRAYEMLQLANKTEESYGLIEISQILGEFEQKEATKEQMTRLHLEQELTNQKSENAIIRVRSNLQLAIFSIALLLAIIAIVLYYYVVKRKHNIVLKESNNIINQQKALLEENYNKLEIKEKKLVELNATKDKFFSIIAHDLKNPFSVLIGLSDIMLNESNIKKSKEIEQIVDGMFQTATLGYNLLENLLEWARAQTGNLEYKPDNLKLKDIITFNASYFKETAKSKGISIEIQNPLNLEAFADYNMVNFIVRNLMNNAIKFSYENSKIEISVIKKEDNCIVKFQDYGIGMSSETVDKLFKIESIVQQKGTAGETGTGLGLILCQEFVEKNFGKIWVESTEKKGSCFSFSLPAEKKKL